MMTREKVVNLIVDMTKSGATSDELLRATDFSAVLIMCESQVQNSYSYNRIGELIKKYGGANEEE